MSKRVELTKLCTSCNWSKAIWVLDTLGFFMCDRRHLAENSFFGSSLTEKMKQLRNDCHYGNQIHRLWKRDFEQESKIIVFHFNRLLPQMIQKVILPKTKRIRIFDYLEWGLSIKREILRRKRHLRPSASLLNNERPFCWVHVLFLFAFFFFFLLIGPKDVISCDFYRLDFSNYNKLMSQSDFSVISFTDSTRMINL